MTPGSNTTLLPPWKEEVTQVGTFRRKRGQILTYQVSGEYPGLGYSVLGSRVRLDRISYTKHTYLLNLGEEDRKSSRVQGGDSLVGSPVGIGSGVHVS